MALMRLQQMVDGLGKGAGKTLTSAKTSRAIATHTRVTKYDCEHMKSLEKESEMGVDMRKDCRAEVDFMTGDDKQKRLMRGRGWCSSPCREPGASIIRLGKT
eukprot:3865953-Amphidinium_carterae.1